MHPTYPDIYEQIPAQGWPIASRYGDTWETSGGVVDYRAGEVPHRQGLNLRMGFMEACCVLAGVHDNRAIARVAPKADLSLFTEAMSYGPRLRDQLPVIVEALRENPDTRQAVAFVGRPENGPTNDQPCTVATQFLLRHGSLRSLVFMRSWDVTRGLPYDMIVQGMLNMAVARAVGARPGDIRTMAGSFHLYGDQMDKAPSGRMISFGLGTEVPRTWDGIVHWAREHVELGDRYPRGLLVDGRTPE